MKKRLLSVQLLNFQSESFGVNTAIRGRIAERGDLANEPVEFSYDNNGNLTMDLDRNIVTIRYNFLNLPDTIQFMNGNQIIHCYDAAGRKLKTEYVTAPANIVVPISGTVNSQATGFTRYGTIYNGNMEYLFGNWGDVTLARIHNPEGYVEYNTPDDGFEGDIQEVNHYNYYREDHLGNVREVWSAPYYTEKNYGYIQPFGAYASQRTQYYPSGLPWKANPGDNPGMQPYKFNGCEFIETHGLDATDLGNRSVYHARGRFDTMDRFCEKFPWQSPYVHAGNNPVRYVDVRGDSIWYTRDDNVITMHVTGKVINQSSDNINIDRAASDIASGINDAFDGEFEYGGQTYTLKTDVQLESVTTMDDVASSDHLFVLADADGKSARGATNMIGGKVMTIAASDYANDNWFSNTFSSNNTRSAVHEFGHAAGLRHVSGLSNAFNLMNQSGFGGSISPSQRTTMIDNWNKINIGSNSYMGRPYPFVHDPKTGKVYRASDLLNWTKRFGRE